MYLNEYIYNNKNKKKKGKHIMKKRIFSLLLAAVMLFSCLSLNVFAADSTETSGEPAKEEMIYYNDFDTPFWRNGSENTKGKFWDGTPKGKYAVAGTANKYLGLGYAGSNAQGYVLLYLLGTGNSSKYKPTDTQLQEAVTSGNGGKSYVLSFEFKTSTLGFTMSNNATVKPLQVYSYFYPNADDPYKFIPFQIDSVLDDGTITSAMGDVIDGFKLEANKTYNIVVFHKPVSNTYDLYIDGVQVLGNEQALDDDTVFKFNENLVAVPNAASQYIPTQLRLGDAKPAEAIDEAFAYDNFKVYRTESYGTEGGEDSGEDSGSVKLCEGAKVVSRNISLGKYIDVNVKMSISGALKATEGAKVVLSTESKSREFLLADAVAESDGTYKFSLPLFATEMTEEVSVTVAGVESSETYTTSIKEYVEQLIETDATAAALGKAILNYGAAAQTYFDVNVDNLANSSLDEADSAIADVLTALSDLNAGDYSADDKDAEDGVAFTSASLAFGSKTHVNLYFTASEAVTVTVNGKAVTPVKAADGEYYITITNETPDMLTENYSIVLTDGDAQVVTNTNYAQILKVGISYATANEKTDFYNLLNAYGRYCIESIKYVESLTGEV